MLIGCEEEQVKSWEDVFPEEIEETVETKYSKEDLDIVVEALLEEMVELKYEDVDISYDGETKIFTVTEYNIQGEIFDIDEYTIDEIINIILEREGK